MDGGGVTVEEDRALLELLEDCSEPAGVTVTEAEAEKAGLHEKQRVECGETWDQAAEVVDQVEARLMLLHEAEFLTRGRLRDGLKELLRAARLQEVEVGSPPPPPSPSPHHPTPPPCTLASIH